MTTTASNNNRRRRVRSTLAGAALLTAAVLAGPMSPASARSADGPTDVAPATAERSARSAMQVAAAADRGPTRSPYAIPDWLIAPNCGIVPDVIGMTIEDAIAEIEAASPYFWVLLDYGSVPEGQAEIGTIFFQSQTPGTALFDCEVGVDSMVSITAVQGYVP